MGAPKALPSNPKRVPVDGIVCRFFVLLNHGQRSRCLSIIPLGIGGSKVMVVIDKIIIVKLVLDYFVFGEQHGGRQRVKEIDLLSIRFAYR